MVKVFLDNLVRRWQERRSTEAQLVDQFRKVWAEPVIRPPAPPVNGVSESESSGVRFPRASPIANETD